MLLSTGCGFEYMVGKSMSGGAGEECLEGIIQTVKDLIAQADIKVKDAGDSVRAETSQKSYFN